MDSQSIVGMWDTIFAQQNERFPWESKLPQVVWRGALSGDINNYQNIRWRLCVLMTKLRASSESIADQFDIGLTRVPDRHNHLSLNLTEAGGLAKPILEKDFQMYRAILDVDGNAWSKRFGQLLCFNSVVLKVEPSFVEYLYKDLIAWKHFVPVKADFSDLVEISAYILDPSNEHVVRSIISDANEWCRASMIQAKLVNDTCDILENYVGILDKADAFWMETWSNASKEIKAPDKGYKMTKL